MLHILIPDYQTPITFTSYSNAYPKDNSESISTVRESDNIRQNINDFSISSYFLD